MIKQKHLIKRIIECPDINAEIKRRLKRQYENLNPVELKKQPILQGKNKRKIGECVGIDF